MENALQEAQRIGQSIWYDNMRRGLLTSGELQRLVDIGVTGLTSNPTIFEKAIAGSTDYDEAMEALAREGKSTIEAYEALTIEDIQGAADLLRPVYDRTDGSDGFASLEVSPKLAHDTEGTVEEARRLFAELGRPNVMVKVPATPEGVPAIRQLIGEGININVTLIFSLEAYAKVREAYIAGIEDLARRGGDFNRVASVASFFVSRVDTAVDALLDGRIREGQQELDSLLGKAAVANAKLAYRAFNQTFGTERFEGLRAEGARVQRPLWGSTGTKNPAYSDVLYVESLMGPDTVNTMPEATLTAFLEHGTADSTLDRDVDEAEQALDALEAAGVSMEQVTDNLLADGVKAFAASFDTLLENIDEKMTRLRADGVSGAGTSLGEYTSAVDDALEGLSERGVVGRIWTHDHTVWKDDPREIADRLGWLNVTETMSEQTETLRAFAEEVKDAGYRHAVLLGMGGSSLGPEVLRHSLGSADGFPQLIVLDSTVPDAVKGVADTIDAGRTLFLVSSKSGTTTEPLTFYRYFRAEVEAAIGSDQAGRNFVAVTDPRTQLAQMAERGGFRRIFVNPPDMGGRYSVLSYFGLVPAALAGMDVHALLHAADCMREGCAAVVPVRENPGAWLGAVMGTLAQRGRDKLTLVASPSIDSFGLWVEQLIAESTGKEGKGIVPVAGEPMLEPESYGEDRLFVYLRLGGDENDASDAATERLADAGQPVVRLDLRDRYDLGAEFFRWEFATAVAGSLLGVHPFDQPNVQQAKDETARMLDAYRSSGELADQEADGSLGGLLSQARPGDYLAVMAYLNGTPETDEALAALRRSVAERHRIATTLGYGPRFLHSTGQLHKGGPGMGLFLQLTAARDTDLDVPGEPYTFGVLADAQALGDLRALRSAGRRVARVEVPSDVASAIRELAEGLA